MTQEEIGTNWISNQTVKEIVSVLYKFSQKIKEGTILNVLYGASIPATPTLKAVTRKYGPVSLSREM